MAGGGVGREWLFNPSATPILAFPLQRGGGGGKEQFAAFSSMRGVNHNQVVSILLGHRLRFQAA